MPLPKPPTVAIVDDDASVCRAISRLVRSLGYKAETFSSGQKFLDRLDAAPSQPVDCLVLDQQMPEMRGLEVQGRLVAAGRRIPIVFITAHETARDRDQALAAGAIQYLTKPFGDEVMVRALEAALGRKEFHGL